MEKQIKLNGLSLITMSRYSFDFIQKYEVFPVILDEMEDINSGKEERACNKSNTLTACFAVIIAAS